MIYLLYIPLAALNLLITFGIAYPFAFVLPIFAKPMLGWCDNHAYEAVEPRLPTWMKWLMTPDNSLNGDATFQGLNPPSFIHQGKWLWRNPNYAFAIKYLTYPYVGKVNGNKTIKDNDNAKAGWCFVRVNGLFLFRYILRIPFTSRCVLGNMGWNIIGTVDDNVQPKPLTWQATFACTPFRLSGFR